jgi:hypothetical protein
MNLPEDAQPSRDQASHRGSTDRHRAAVAAVTGAIGTGKTIRKTIENA